MNEMGNKCDIEQIHPGQSLVMWAFAPGYDASLPDNVKNPPEELYDKNYKWARHTYDYVIHYTRHPFKSIPCLNFPTLPITPLSFFLFLIFFFLKNENINSLYRIFDLI